jgi:iron complex transport system permease protein
VHPVAPLPRASIAAALFLLVTTALGLAIGTEPVSAWRAWSDPASLDRVILLTARAPRVALAMVAGSGLAAAGVAFQAVLGNPLAEPYVLGVSGGAAFGATLALVAGSAGLTFVGASFVSTAALAGGLAATGFVYAIARGARETRTSMLLAGVVVNSMTAAGITLVKTLVTETQAHTILFWLVGFLDVASPVELAAVTGYVLLGATLLLRDAGRLNLLALGDEGALHLGVDVTALQRRTFLACSLVVGAVVSVTGLIGFIGLIVPHVLRRLFGPDVRTLLPASLFAGAGTLVLCDVATRLLFRWFYRELPVGAITALLGGPLFLMLLRRPERVP